MLIHRYPTGVWSVAYAPDGTLYALTAKNCELWAHPPDGSGKVLVAKQTDANRLEGTLDVSPNGQWLSVSGYRALTLFRIGPFAHPVMNPTGLSRLSGWQDWGHSRPDSNDPTVFTGDSAFCVNRVKEDFVGTTWHLRCWRLPDLSEFRYAGFGDINCQRLALIPGTPFVVVEGWSAKHDAAALWQADLAQPNAPAELIGTIKQAYFNGLLIGGDGRYYVLTHGTVLVFTLSATGFQLVREIRLPEFKSTPKLALSADGTRFVASCFRNKLVYAGRTDTDSVSGPWDWKIGDVNDVTIAPDGLTAAAAGSNKKVVVWDLE